MPSAKKITSRKNTAKPTITPAPKRATNMSKSKAKPAIMPAGKRDIGNAKAKPANNMKKSRSNTTVATAPRGMDKNKNVRPTRKVGERPPAIKKKATSKAIKNPATRGQRTGNRSIKGGQTSDII